MFVVIQKLIKSAAMPSSPSKMSPLLPLNRYCGGWYLLLLIIVIMSSTDNIIANAKLFAKIESCSG
jgi:hypothetical protein